MPGGEDRLLRGRGLRPLRPGPGGVGADRRLLHDQRVPGGPTDDIRRRPDGGPGHRDLPHRHVPDGQLHGGHHGAGDPHGNVQQQHQLLAGRDGHANHGAADQSHLPPILSRFVINFGLRGMICETRFIYRYYIRYQYLYLNAL